ncbi:hypothetical protein QJS10_CPB12g00714 [Acorus calamus]|uniref:Uncharacterized protein n=1 Tax=Acorus calamus TaxID=4465 RepID=A0AAV9DNT8_ACOCL|nr:hypothetical protein QJS10_CPB12g00714 [Acorus calamus]
MATQCWRQLQFRFIPPAVLWNDTGWLAMLTHRGWGTGPQRKWKQALFGFGLWQIWRLRNARVHGNPEIPVVIGGVIPLHYKRRRKPLWMVKLGYKEVMVCTDSTTAITLFTDPGPGPPHLHNLKDQWQQHVHAMSQTSIPSTAPPMVPVSGASNYRSASLATVDYAPRRRGEDSRESDITSSGGYAVFGEEFQTSVLTIVQNHVRTTCAVGSARGICGRMYRTCGHTRAADIELAVSVSIEIQEEVDPLKKFLHRQRMYAQKSSKQGKSFNANLRNRKDYRNPDFLQHTVRYQDINQIGTCFSKDVFDPHGDAE